MSNLFILYPELVNNVICCSKPNNSNGGKENSKHIVHRRRKVENIGGQGLDIGGAKGGPNS